MIYSIDCTAGGVTFTSGIYGCSDPAGTVTATPVAYAIDTTDPTTNFTDGMILGWGVVAAMAAAYGIHLMRRALT